MSKRNTILLIVEGQAEQSCMPGFLTRWFMQAGHTDFAPHPTVLCSKTCTRIISPVNETPRVGVEKLVAQALRSRPDGILVIVDSDDECIKRERERRLSLGPELRARAQGVATHIPLQVVVANRNFEAWFIAAWPHILPRLNRRAEKSVSEQTRRDAEVVRGHARHLTELLGTSYEKTIHQRELSRHLPFEGDTLEYAPSYRRLLRALDELVVEVRRRKP